MATARSEAQIAAAQAAGALRAGAHSVLLLAIYCPALMSVLGMLVFNCPELLTLDPGLAALMRRMLDCQPAVRARLAGLGGLGG